MRSNYFISCITGLNSYLAALMTYLIISTGFIGGTLGAITTGPPCQRGPIASQDTKDEIMGPLYQDKLLYLLHACGKNYVLKVFVKNN